MPSLVPDKLYTSVLETTHTLQYTMAVHPREVHVINYVCSTEIIVGQQSANTKQHT